MAAQGAPGGRGRATGTPSRTGRHRGLDRDRLAAAALEIIADNGVGGLNARTLAARLQVAPSALYKHLPGMDALLDLVLDRVLGEVEVTLDARLTWREQVEALAHRLRGALRAHPGVAAVLSGRDPLGANSDRMADAFARVLLRAGFHGPEAGHAWYTLVHYVIGFEATFALDRANLDRAYDERALAAVRSRFDQLDADALPGLRELGRHIWSPVLDERFDYGLAVLLDGLALRVAR
ncbi:TetR/AcrR family transcriptional regulator C-terminal domain-containing protein [Geodermatophilus sp. SYSU D00815]